MIWVLILMAVVGFYPQTSIWWLARVGWAFLLGLLLCVAWVAFWG